MENTLKEIAKIFETSVTWNQKTQTLQDLKNSMALLCHLLSHNIRDIRGTAAENEWLERSIYQSLGIDCAQNLADHSVDLEAFANPLFSDFKKMYDKMTDLRMK